MTDLLTYSVPDVNCAHCQSSITQAVTQVQGVEAVDVDLEHKHVTVQGAHVDEGAVRAAIHEAGYEVAARVTG